MDYSPWFDFWESKWKLKCSPGKDVGEVLDEQLAGVVVAVEAGQVQR